MMPTVVPGVVTASRLKTEQELFLKAVEEKDSQIKCVALQDLIPFVQFKRREKHPWRSVTFSNVAN